MAIKIDVLMPTSSQYGVLHHFTQKMYEALVQQGVVCRLLSGDDMVLVPWNSPPDLTLGFNGALQMEDGSLFCDLIKVPHVACLVDPPYRFLNLTNSPFIVIACDDQEGCRLLRGRGFDRTVFMPHAVEANVEEDSGGERIYDIVFLGTCIDVEKRHNQWKKIFSPEICRLMEEVAEKTLAEDSTSYISLLAERLDSDEYRQVFEEVELYIKGMDRLRLLEAFPEQRIDLFGGDDGKMSWTKLLKGQSNVFVHPSVTFEGSLQIMRQSKIVLNSSIKNKLGGHERIFSAMACGAVVVTNDNAWMRGHFADGKELILYKPETMKEVRRAVSGLLADEAKRSRIAVAGRKKVLEAHTWGHRAKQLLHDIVPMLKIT